MGYEQMQNNRAYVAGKVLSAPVFSHEVMGERFYDFVLGVRRLSEQEDEIPVTVSDRLFLSEDELAVGTTVAVEGQLRSYNKIVDGKSKLVLRIFARELCEPSGEAPNVIELEGYVCKTPVYRTTPFKREICDLLLAVNRAYNKSDYIPAIAWGRNARYAGEFKVGDRVSVVGRIGIRSVRFQNGKGRMTCSGNRIGYSGEVSSH